MSESVRWALALTYLGSLFSMAAFLIYKRVPGWGWFLAVVCVVVSSTTIHIDAERGRNDDHQQGSPMTNQNSAAQAAMQGTVSDADLLRICQQFNPGQDLDLAKAVRAEVLSQLRCPVADIRIGVSASGQGATICIMQPYADGSTTTIYSEMHPLGDSMGRATWWAPRKRQCAEGHAGVQAPSDGPQLHRPPFLGPPG